MPRRAAGMPNWLFAEAMRRSACMAIASPPPRQKPWIAAIFALGKSASFARPPLVRRAYSSCASALARRFSNWLMSAPQRLAAGAGHDHHPHRGVVAEVVEDCREP